MTEAQVLQIVGEPLYRGTNKYAANWVYYTLESKKFSCQGKELSFDQNWIVNKVDVWFKDIKLGIHKDEVLKKIGKPNCYTEFDDSYEYTWGYTSQGEIIEDYDRRWITFNREGRVVEVTHEYYVD